jgi:hypothetical protein
MDKLLFFIKIAVFIEIALIILFILFNYTAKVYYFFKAKREKEQIKNIETLFAKFRGKKDLAFDQQTIKYLRHHILIVLRVISLLENEKPPMFNGLLIELSEQVLKPNARKMAVSKKWFKRYLAVKCFSYGFSPQDEIFLLQLISDNSLLISLNAALVTLQYPSVQSINKIIDVYAKGRRLQQSSFAEILTKEAPAIQTMIAERLSNELDPYVKIFCYHLLVKLPPTEVISSFALDIKSENLDLKIAVLNYLAHVKKNAQEEIRSFLTNPHWQIRAAAAKLLGQLKDKKSLILLNTCLRDSEWWVRINAAQALSVMGDEGLLILREQDPSIDRYAYEEAQQILKILEN